MSRRRLPPLSEQQISTIRKCASRGIRWEDISIIVGRAEASIQRDKVAMASYREGRAQCKLAVANSLFAMATGGRHPAATIFAAKAILGWREDGSSFTEQADDAATLSIPGAHFGKVKA